MSLARVGFIAIPPGAKPGFDHADVHRQRRRLYVAHTGADRIEVLDCNARSYLRALPAELPGVAGVLIDEEQDLLFSSDRGAARVSIFGCSDEELHGQLDVGPHPNGLAYDRERRQLYSFNLGEPPGENCTASIVALEHGQLAAVGRAEEATRVEPEPVRTGSRYLERVLDQRALTVDDDDLRRLLDVGVDDVSLRVVDGPARPTRQRQLGDHLHRVGVDDRDGAVFAWLTEVEAVEVAPLSVVGEPVRVRPNLDLSEQLLVGAAEDADPRGAAVAREKQVVLLVDQHTGDAG